MRVARRLPLFACDHQPTKAVVNVVLHESGGAPLFCVFDLNLFEDKSRILVVFEQLNAWFVSLASERRATLFVTIKKRKLGKSREDYVDELHI